MRGGWWGGGGASLPWGGLAHRFEPVSWILPTVQRWTGCVVAMQCIHPHTAASELLNSSCFPSLLLMAFGIRIQAPPGARCRDVMRGRQWPGGGKHLHTIPHCSPPKNAMCGGTGSGSQGGEARVWGNTGSRGASPARGGRSVTGAAFAWPASPVRCSRCSPGRRTTQYIISASLQCMCICACPDADVGPATGNASGRPLAIVPYLWPQLAAARAAVSTPDTCCRVRACQCQ